MGRDLYENNAAARAVFDQADEQLGFSLSSLCFEGPEGELTDTVNQQPALFTTSFAMFMALKTKEAPPPAFAAGHSLGELSALAAAGSLTFADGLALVRRRGELMKQAGEREPGAMAAVLGLDVPAVERICTEVSAEHGRFVQIANDNCPGQIVISGDKNALHAAVAAAKEAGARKVVVLPITIAAHSQLMAPAAAEFTKAVAATPLYPPAIPVISNISARPLQTVAEIRNELEAQLTSPVYWTDSMTWLTTHGVTAVMEIGPGDVLLSLMKRIHRKTKRLKWKIEE